MKWISLSVAIIYAILLFLLLLVIWGAISAKSKFIQGLTAWGIAGVVIYFLVMEGMV